MELDYLLNYPEQFIGAKRYAQCELYLNPGSPSGYSKVKEGISEPFNPMNYLPKPRAYYRRIEPLNFPWYWVDRSNLDYLEANPSSEMLEFLGKAQDGDNNKLKFVIHADAKDRLLPGHKPNGWTPAYLTAATRTVITASSHPLFLKLHYDKMIGRCPRRLEQLDLQQSLFYSARFDEWSKAGLLSKTFAFLPETVGLLWRTDNDTIGLIGREFIPRPAVEGQHIMIPFFALPTKDRGCRESPTLLTQIISWNSSAGCNPQDVFFHITRLIFESLQSLFARQERPGNNGADKCRLLHDSHAQNLLLEMDNKGYPQRVIFRDLSHLYPIVLDESDRIDFVQENLYGKVLDIRQNPGYTVKKMSQLIDCKLGVYVIKPLIANFATSFGYRRKDIVAEVRTQFRQVLGPICDVLPRGLWFQRKGSDYDEHGRTILEEGKGLPLLRR